MPCRLFDARASLLYPFLLLYIVWVLCVWSTHSLHVLVSACRTGVIGGRHSFFSCFLGLFSAPQLHRITIIWRVVNCLFFFFFISSRFYFVYSDCSATHMNRKKMISMCLCHFIGCCRWWRRRRQSRWQKTKTFVIFSRVFFSFPFIWFILPKNCVFVLERQPQYLLNIKQFNRAQTRGRRREEQVQGICELYLGRLLFPMKSFDVDFVICTKSLRDDALPNYSDTFCFANNTFDSSDSKFFYFVIRFLFVLFGTS